MPGFPQEPITGALAQLMAKLKPGPITGAGFPGQGTPPDMSTIPGAGQHQPTPSPYPPEGYIPPLMGPVKVGSLPQDPEAQEYWKADAAAAEQFRQQQAGPVGLPPPIPPSPGEFGGMAEPPMPPYDPFAIPQGPPSPIDIQPMPPTPPPSALERVQGMPDPLQPHGGTGLRFGGPTPTLQGLRQDAMKSPPPRTP